MDTHFLILRRDLKTMVVTVSILTHIDELKSLFQFNFICLGKTFMVMSSRGSMKKSDTSLKKIR